jgi:DNA-binding transcriptional regulator YdaS (Cro superfamily)
LNVVGQLGDNTTTQRLTPVDVSGLASGVVTIAAGGSHTCALTTGGGVKCWGNNSEGQLGIGSGSPAVCSYVPCALAPVDVTGLTSGVAAIAAARKHTCALTTGGGVKCWGSNVRGQLGDNSITSRSTPVDVSGLANGVAAIAAGDFHTCALTAGGGVKCWGYNSEGQLGIGSASPAVCFADPCALSPVDVSGLASGAAAIAAGGTHTCALTTGGGVKCWGANNYGQVGDGTGSFRPFPGDVLVASTTPGAFGFAEQSDVPLSSLRTSNAIAISGLEAAAPITVANGEYSLGCGANFVATAGLISPGQSVCVRHTSAATRSAAITTTLTIGGVAGSFTSKTAANASGTALAGPASSIQGTQVTFTATVTGDVPTGTIAFKDGAATIAGCGAVALASSQAQCMTSSLALGSHAVTAEFGGDSRNAPSASAALAHFVSPPPGFFALTVSKAGNGSGTVTSSPAGIDCGATCAFGFTEGTPVTLSAAVATGSVFAGWSGACAGTGSCTVTMDAAKGVTATFQPLTGPPRLFNISTRGRVETGNDVMIGGFIIGGPTPKKVLITARGPSLSAFGVAGALANPVLWLYSGQNVIATNDNWGTAPNVAEITATGIAPSNALESAILMTLNPGAYTAIVRGVGGSTGVGIVEVFEIDHPEVPLINISTRGQVQSGDNVMIGGFIIQGDAPRTVLITARGPSLSDFGITNPLANPLLQLFSGQTQIASNDDWQTNANVTAIQATGVAPTNPLESAILMTLNPGAYTAIVSGAGGGTGVGIVEVFAQ